MMNIIAASRLRQLPVDISPNMFIEQVENENIVKTDIEGWLLGVEVLNFQKTGNSISFRVNQTGALSENIYFNNISTKIKNLTILHNLSIPSSFDSTATNINSFYSLQENVNYFLRFRSTGLKNHLSEQINVTNFISCFDNTSGGGYFIFNNLAQLSDGSSFQYRAFGKKVFSANKAVLLENSQGLEMSGEIFITRPEYENTPSGVNQQLDYIRNQFTNVIYAQNYTLPTASTISANTISVTYVELNVSQPTHINNLKYALVFVDGFFQGVYDINNVFATNLQQQTSYDIKVIIADEYFNISPYSNTINVTTILKSDYTISQNNVGGTYIKIEENYISPIETKTVDVYANGVFNNTITNAGKGGVYAVNLNEQTNYDIYLIIEGNQSNAINVTTTTTPALYQNTVAYYKLDDTRGDAIDVVNGYNGTLFGSVTQGVNGKIDTAYSFNGIDGFVESSLDMSIYTSFTVRAWFKTSDTGDNCIFSTGQPNGISSRFDIVIESGVLFIRLDGGNISYTSFSLNDNNWHRVVMIVPTNSNTLDFRAFVDGVELFIAQNTNNNPLNIQSGLTRFGKTTRNDGFFNGEIDEICIDENYNLTLTEISDDYNNGIGTTI